MFSQSRYITAGAVLSFGVEFCLRTDMSCTHSRCHFASGEGVEARISGRSFFEVCNSSETAQKKAVPNATEIAHCTGKAFSNSVLRKRRVQDKDRKRACVQGIPKPNKNNGGCGVHWIRTQWVGF